MGDLSFLGYDVVEEGGLYVEFVWELYFGESIMATCEFYILEEDVMGIAFGRWVCIVEIYDIVYHDRFDIDFLDIGALRYSALMDIINQIQ